MRSASANDIHFVLNFINDGLTRSSHLETVNVICFSGYLYVLLCHCQPVILDYLASKTICSDDLVVVSPDVGGVARARAFAKKLSDAPLAIVDKRRHGHNVAEV